jgi:putative membrane protein
MPPGLRAPSPWIWHPHFDVWVLVAVLAAGYLTAIRKVGPQFVEPGESSASKSQIRFWFLGVFTILVAADWPVHDLAERYLYSVHMIQHMLLTLVAPPLLLAGTPHWLARKVLRPRWLMWITRRITRPVPALLIFNGILVLSHWPAVVDATLRSEPLHFLSHSVLFLSAIVMWWPILSPLPEIPRASYPAQMLYLFLQTIVPTVPASFLTFADHPIYHFYETIPRWFSIPVLEDQRIAGLEMKILGGLLLWSVIAVLFFRWSSKEERPEVPDVLEWQQVERELNQPIGDVR